MTNLQNFYPLGLYWWTTEGTTMGDGGVERSKTKCVVGLAHNGLDEKIKRRSN